MAFNIRQIFKALADAQVEYVVVGGFAVIMYGHLRATADLDLVIGLDGDNCRRGLDALHSIGSRLRLPVAMSDFAFDSRLPCRTSPSTPGCHVGLRLRLPVAMSDFADPDKRADWIENRNMLVFQLWDPGNAERSVDIFVREPFDFGLMRSEAVTKNLDGVTIPWLPSAT